MPHTLAIRHLRLVKENVSDMPKYCTMKNLCRGYNLLPYILGESKEATSSNDPTPKTDEELTIDSIVLTWIFTTLSKPLQQRLVVENPKTAKEAWEILELIFKDNKRSRSIALKAELCSMKLGELSIDAYFRRIESTATILSCLRSPISNDDVVNIALDGLPDKYQNVSDIIIHRDPFSDLKTMRSMLTTAEMRLKSRAQASYVDSTSSSLMVLLANSGTNTRRSTPSMDKVHKSCFNLNKDSCSGPAAFPARLHGFNGPAIPLHHYPAALLAGPFGISRSTTSTTIYDGPESDSATSVWIIGSDGTLGSTGSTGLSTSTGDLYPVTNPSPVPHAFVTSQYTWHRRLGHPGNEVLRRVLSSNSISYNKEKSPVLCHACQLGKHVRLPLLDVKNAFLHGDLSETVYMNQSPGFMDSTHPNYRKYATEILEQAHMVGCNSSRNPVDTESKLGDDGDPVSDSTLYRSLAGSLQYLTFTRPDISYDVQQVCLHMHDPREPHFSALKRVLRYVRGTLDYGLQLFSSSNNPWLPIRMRIGLVALLLGEVEYRGVANAVAETCWLRNLLRELHTPLSSAMLVYCDNVSAVYLSSNPVRHQRTKHIEIDIHFVRDLVTTGHVRVLHVPSHYQFADIFTKGLPSALFEEFCSSLSVRCPPALTAGECYCILVG
ncbi:ribonuclease H-like domain-containing protein [Tanacetum coccineum]|uniref:Ribonuclease H-like domain-containing protein n=1 Tax=Tanacetum coccineum TaxID=301880 RepID=A0ABQ5IGX2_9ASTR